MRFELMSKFTTGHCLANSTARGRPTWPRPMGRIFWLISGGSARRRGIAGELAPIKGTCRASGWYVAGLRDLTWVGYRYVIALRSGPMSFRLSVTPSKQVTQALNRYSGVLEYVRQRRTMGWCAGTVSFSTLDVLLKPDDWKPFRLLAR